MQWLPTLIVGVHHRGQAVAQDGVEHGAVGLSIVGGVCQADGDAQVLVGLGERLAWLSSEPEPGGDYAIGDVA